MSKSARSIVSQFIDAAWRRRYLLLTPVLILTLLSIPGVLLVQLPGSYVARSLMLLRETNTNNPLSKDASPLTSDAMKELVVGLQALVNSEYVLGPVVETLNEELKTSPKKRAITIEGYRKHLSIELIGHDFLEFSLKGAHPEGLGRQLDIITSRFLEALTAQGGTSVGVALISKRKEELDIAEQENASLKQRLAAVLPGGLEAHLAQIAAVDRRIPEATRTLASINTELEEVRGQLGNPADERIQRELAGLGDGSHPDSAPQGQGANATPPSARAVLLRKFQELDRSRDTLQNEIDNDTGTKERLQRSLDAYEAINRQFQGSEKTVAAMQETYEAYKRRLGSAATNRGVSVLRAPERIIVIDAPKDPELGGIPRSYFVLSGIAAGLLIGLGLTVAAELMDTTVRYPGQLGAMTGVPIIARLPNTRGQIDVPAAEAPPRELTHDSAAPQPKTRGSPQGR